MEMSVWQRIWRAPTFSPLGFLVRGLLLVCFFVICESLGWREYTAILSGTSPTGAPLDSTMSLIGCTYFVAYSLVVLVAPVLMIAAVVLRLMLGATGTADADLPSDPLEED